MLILLIIVVIVLIVSLILVKSYANNYEKYTNEKIADSIYKAEGGAKAKVPYGILSVKTNDPRKICINTIRNHRIRHKKHKCNLDFISCLGNRYVPVNCGNDNGTNRFWIKNVKFFLENN